MTDELLKELWNTKDTIAKEHGNNIDELAEYYLHKQTIRHGLFHQDEKLKIKKLDLKRCSD